MTTDTDKKTRTVEPTLDNENRLKRSESIGPLVRRVTKVPEVRALDGIDVLQSDFNQWKDQVDDVAPA